MHLSRACTKTPVGLFQFSCRADHKQKSSALESDPSPMQTQQSPLAYIANPLCTVCCGPGRRSSLQYSRARNKMLWNSHKGYCSLMQQAADKTSNHTLTFPAALSIYRCQHRKTPCSLHSVSSVRGSDHAGRGSTQLAAGSFMGLMGQILKDMSQTLPSGSSLIVDKLSYHPAGSFLWCTLPSLLHTPTLSGQSEPEHQPQQLPSYCHSLLVRYSPNCHVVWSSRHTQCCNAMNAGSPEPLLSDLSLQLPANQLGLIYGRSGAGKTTLLQLLAGLTEISTGQIRLGVGTHQFNNCAELTACLLT